MYIAVFIIIHELLQTGYKTLQQKNTAITVCPAMNNEPYPTGSRIGILYELPKIRTCSIPFRPILSGINNQLIISFVLDLLSSNLDSRNVIMASFDVPSRCTNMPVDETVEIIFQLLYKTGIFQQLPFSRPLSL